MLAGAEPAVLAGVLSAVVFEPRRARRVPGQQGPRREKQRKPAAGPARRQAPFRVGLALRRPGRPGRTHPDDRGGAPRSPHPPAGARPGDLSGLVGPGRLVLDRPGRGRPRRRRAGAG